MEASGASFIRHILFPPGAAFVLNRQQKRSLISCVNVRKRNLNLCVKKKPNPMRIFGSGDDRELMRSRSMITCGEKKQMKLRKKLEKGLEKFAGMGFGIDPKRGLVAEVEANMITEAAEVLLKQLHNLRASEKESKRKKKHKRKTMLVQDVYSESLSPASDSNEFKELDDGDKSWKQQLLYGSGVGGAEAVRQVLKQSLECAGEPISSIKSESKELCGSVKVPEMRDVVSIILIHWILKWFAPVGVNAGAEAAQISTLGKTMSSDSSATCCGNSSAEVGCHNGMSNTSPEKRLGKKKIEVCMSGKCRKSGSPQLLQEFQTLANNESEGHIAVAGCKCLGECKNGPNLRLSATNATPAICFGVEMEDVNTIMISFLELE